MGVNNNVLWKDSKKTVWRIGVLSAILLVVTLAVSQAGAGDIRGAFIDRLVLVLSLFHFLEHE